GGGRGGITPANGEETAYRVPWKIMKVTDPVVGEGITVYWFPSSVDEARRSSLLTSRQLTLYSSQCVSMVIADSGFDAVQYLLNGSKLPIVVVLDNTGKTIARIDNKGGNLNVEQVEKTIDNEVKQRESA